MRLNDIKVGPRLALSFGLVLLITAVIAAVGVWRLQDLAAATQRLTSTDNERLRAAVQWRQGIDQNWIRTRAALLNADSSHLAQWQAEMDATSKGVDVSRKTVERLKGLRLVYPDGTLQELVNKVIAKKLMDALA